MTALNAAVQQVETPTVDAMNTAVSMFAMMTGKTLTAAEGYHFLTIWSMVAKTEGSAAAMTPPAAPVAVAPAAVIPAPVEAIPAPAAAPVQSVIHSPSTPASAAVSAPCSPTASDAVAAKAAPTQKTAEPERMTMPPVEEIQVSGIAQPLRRVPASFRNESRFWVEGYNWKIMVEPFDAHGEKKAYYVHYRNKPTQEEFAEHYAHFTATENRCKVHVMESNGSDSYRITDEYCRFLENDQMHFGSKETLRPVDEWEEGARYRLRFADKRLNGQTNYIYYANKPSQAQRDAVSFAKGVVLVEKRPDHPNA